MTVQARRASQSQHTNSNMRYTCHRIFGGHLDLGVRGEVVEHVQQRLQVHGLVLENQLEDAPPLSASPLNLGNEAHGCVDARCPSRFSPRTCKTLIHRCVGPPRFCVCELLRHTPSAPRQPSGVPFRRVVDTTHNRWFVDVGRMCVVHTSPGPIFRLSL